jgi:membrane protein
VPDSTTKALSKTAPRVEVQNKMHPQRYSGLVLSTIRYLLRTEVHTFAFSVAATALLSFFPFVVLLMTLIRRVFHSPVMYDVVVQLLRDYLPAGQDFVIRNLNALVGVRHRVQVFSLVILLVTSTGIFMPLEVALNRIWRFPENRSYLGNQLIALGLVFWCGLLALISIGLTAGNVAIMEFLLRGHATGLVRFVGFLVMKVFAICAHRHLLPHLLAAPKRESAGAGGAADCDHHGPAVGGAEVRVHTCPAMVEFSGRCTILFRCRSA